MADPASVLRVMGSRPGSSRRAPDPLILAAIREAIPAFKHEIEAFCADHLPSLRNKLWDKCIEELPLSELVARQ